MCSQFILRQLEGEVSELLINTQQSSFVNINSEITILLMKVIYVNSDINFEQHIIHFQTYLSTFHLSEKKTYTECL